MPDSSTNNTRVPPATAFSPETIDALIRNQAKDLAVRAEEVSLQKQQDTNNFEFGRQALQAQLEDRNAQREHAKTMRWSLYALLAFLSLLLAALLGVCLWHDKDVMALEIIKAIIYIVSGGLGGWGLHSATSNKEDKP
jgi:hypothetical protein